VVMESFVACLTGEVLIFTVTYLHTYLLFDTVQLDYCRPCNLWQASLEHGTYSEPTLISSVIWSLTGALHRKRNCSDLR